jgi:hypothetical protein
MLEPVKEGLLGFFLVLGLWLSPGTERAEIHLRDVEPVAGGYVLRCAMDIAWNEQLGELVDAGIPFRLRIGCVTDAGDTATFCRTLRCDIADYTYTFRDSSIQNFGDTVQVSKRYSQVLVALRDFTRWSFEVSASASSCRIEAELLQSTVSQLNRRVDMSQIWGQRRVSRVVRIAG